MGSQAKVRLVNSNQKEQAWVNLTRVTSKGHRQKVLGGRRDY